MFCKKCGAKISDDSLFCCKCGQKVDSPVSSDAATPTNEPLPRLYDSPEPDRTGYTQPPKETSHGKGLGCGLIIVIILVALILLIKPITLYFQQANTKDDTKDNTKDDKPSSSQPSLLYRPATMNDLEIDADLDFSSLSIDLLLTPNKDIDHLEICIEFYDKNDNYLYSVEKTIGNVKEGIQVTKKISIDEFEWSVLKSAYTITRITNGTVPYFQY